MSTLLNVKTPPRPRMTQEIAIAAKVDSEPTIILDEDCADVSFDDDNIPFDLIVDNSILEEVHQRPTVPMMERLTSAALDCLLEFDV